VAEPVDLRDATPEDLGRLTDLWFRSAADAFLPLLPDGFELPDRSRLGGPAGALQKERTAVVVAEDSEGILGYVTAGASRDPDVLGSVGEIWTLFVEPHAIGRGVGKRLLQAGLAHLREAGLGEVMLWSFLDNERANSFYERGGFHRDGAEKRMEEWSHIPIVRYRCSLRSMSDYTKVNLEDDVEDVAASTGLEGAEARFARKPLKMEQHGVTLFRYEPNVRVPFGHRHEDQEEVYVVLNGSGRIKIEDEIVELEQWDAIHVPGDKMRCIESGPDGAEILASGGAAGQEQSTIEPGWWSD